MAPSGLTVAVPLAGSLVIRTEAASMVSLPSASVSLERTVSLICVSSTVSPVSSSATGRSLTGSTVSITTAVVHRRGSPPSQTV
jgi:hypothetical protein